MTIHTFVRIYDNKVVDLSTDEIRKDTCLCTPQQGILRCQEAKRSACHNFVE